MVRFCPKCGKELEGEFNFCPNCGFELVKFKDKENLQSSSVSANFILCDNCGEENPADSKICSGCGAKLTGEKISKEIKPSQIVESKKTINKPAKIQKPVKKSEEGKKAFQPGGKSKQLDRTKIISIIVVSLAAVFLILLASGVFDSSENPTTAVENQNQQPGINLQDMQRINQLKEQVEKNPNNTGLILELAHLLNDSGFYDDAIKNYQQYLKTNPTNADARIDMGVCYYNLKQYDNAITEMEKALQYQPDHQIGHLNLGIVNLAAGNLDKSKEWLRKAVSLNPNSEIGKRAEELLQSH